MGQHEDTGGERGGGGKPKTFGPGAQLYVVVSLLGLAPVALFFGDGTSGRMSWFPVLAVAFCWTVAALIWALSDQRYIVTEDGVYRSRPGRPARFFPWKAIARLEHARGGRYSPHTWTAWSHASKKLFRFSDYTRDAARLAGLIENGLTFWWEHAPRRSD